jgi:hypothetical protein
LLPQGRVLTTALIDDEQVRMSAYALLAVSFSVATIAGPLVVSAAVLLADPSVAVLLAAAFIGCGGIAFALTPAARGWHPEMVRSEGDARTRSRLLSTGMITLLVANTATGFAAGVAAVALPAAVLAHGPAALTGIAFAIGAAGDVIGGLTYGAIRWSPPERRNSRLRSASMRSSAGRSQARRAYWSRSSFSCLSVRPW